MGNMDRVNDVSTTEPLQNSNPCNTVGELDNTVGELGTVIKTTKRATWSKNVEFFLAIMGYTVGIGSIWRFPIVCSRNGGGAFLIPFFFFLICAGWPLYYMEVCIGQFCGKSAGLAFSFCPLFQGLGFLQVCISFLVTWYGTQLGAWCIYYLYVSFWNTLPWTTCNNDWNTINCTDFGSTTQQNNTINTTLESSFDHKQSSAFEFWEHGVIGRSSGLDNMGDLQLHLYICLLVYTTLIVLAIIKGPRSLGKVVYFSATAPFLLLTVMFIKGLTLHGAIDGIVMYLKPDFGKLLNIQVWLEAAVQVFYSLGPSWGGVITMASYNKFHQQSFWPTVQCVVCSGFTSFYNGLIVFTILGFMAKETGLPIQDVASQTGPGLTFVVFPVALSKMPFPHLWSVLFFLTLITVIFDSHFGTVETVTCGIIDLYPNYLERRRALVSIAAGVFFMLTQIPLCFNGGIYIFQLCDWYFSQFALLFGSLCECIAITWIYGTDRFCTDITMMTGRNVSMMLRCVWMLLVPILAIICFVTMCLKYSAPNYGDGYIYSTEALFVGVCCGLLPIVGMLLVGLITVLRQHGSIVQRFRSSLRPSIDWLPNDDKVREQFISQKYEYPSTCVQRLTLDLIGRNDL